MKTKRQQNPQVFWCEQEELTSVNRECPSEKAAKAVSPKRQPRVEHAGLRTGGIDIGQFRV